VNNFIQEYSQLICFSAEYQLIILILILILHSESDSHSRIKLIN